MSPVRPVETEAVRVQTNHVGANFFQTMGIPILQGRGFDVHDTAASPKVAVVNRALARQFFPNENPIGQTFEADADEANAPVEIVGIAADTRYADLRSETPPTFYLPYAQALGLGRMVVEIHTQAEPGSILSQARTIVASMDRDLPLIDVRTMTEQIQATMSGERIFAQLTSGFGMLALVLACIGIYGIMAYTVARRTGEIGIRMALGAQAGQVLRMVLREASWMALAGVTLGLGCALWLARFLSCHALRPDALGPADVDRSSSPAAHHRRSGSIWSSKACVPCGSNPRLAPPVVQPSATLSSTSHFPMEAPHSLCHPACPGMPWERSRPVPACRGGTCSSLNQHQIPTEARPHPLSPFYAGGTDSLITLAFRNLTLTGLFAGGPFLRTARGANRECRNVL